jgi:hypothetical protein
MTVKISKEKSTITAIDDKTISIFIPVEVKQRGESHQVIIPQHIAPEHANKNYDDVMIKAFAKAYKWKLMIDRGEVSDLMEIAKQEKVDRSYVGKLFRLNFVSPKIVEDIINGDQPRDLQLQDFMVKKGVADVWGM